MAGTTQLMRARQDVPFSCLWRWNWWAVVPLALAACARGVPWLLTHSPAFGFALQRGFALVCHQRPDRCFSVFGGSVAVCARCLGIYVGAAAGLLVRGPRQLAARLMLAALAFNLVDWLAELAGLHGNWLTARFCLGIALGMAGAMIVVARQTAPLARHDVKAAPV